MKDILPGIFLAVGMGMAVWCVSLTGWPVLAVLSIQVVMGAAIYLAGSVVFGIDSYAYLRDILKSFYEKRHQ